jgi:hypothetical protein
MTEQQLKRLHELRDYAREQREKLGYGRPGYDKTEVDKWTNVLTWVILIEESQ